MADKTKKAQKWRTWNVPKKPDGSVPWDGPTQGAEYFISWPNVKQEKVNWVPNEPFKAGLQYVRRHHGRNSTHAVFKDMCSDAEYVMRFDNLDFCLKKGVFILGTILGVWRFRRDAGKYSIVPISFISEKEFNVSSKQS